MEVVPMRRFQIIALAVMTAAAVLFSSGCKDNRTRVSAILQNPDKFISREVTVGGEVTKTYAVNLIIAEAGAYQVDDGTGKIWVITHNGVPREGAKVGLKGTVSNGIKLGHELFGAVIQEKDRRVK